MQRTLRQDRDQPPAECRQFWIEQEPRTGEAAACGSSTPLEQRGIRRQPRRRCPRRKDAKHRLVLQRLESHDLASRADRGELPFERGAHEDDQGEVGRFFKRLEQAVGGLVGEVVGIEDDRHLAATEGRPQEQPPAESLAHAMLGIADERLQWNRRPVWRLRDDVDIGVAATVCLHARRARAAGDEPRARPFAEQRLGKRQGHRALADAGWSDEEIRTPDSAMCGGPHELSDHRILADDLTATYGCLPGHGPTLYGGRVM